MALAQRIESLEHQHAILKAAIQQLESHPYEDRAELMAMKQKRLRLKEELASLTANSNTRH